MNLYKGLFNYSRGLERLYRPANSPKHAWVLMTIGLAEMHGVEARHVRNKFPWVKDGRAKNYEITVEMEVKEVEDDMAAPA